MLLQRVIKSQYPTVFDGHLVHVVHLVHLVHLMYLMYLVHLVTLAECCIQVTSCTCYTSPVTTSTTSPV